MSSDSQQANGALSICVVGVGAIGGFMAARLASNPGVRVSALARGRTLAALRERGLRLVDDAGERLVHLSAVSDIAEDLEPVDVVLFCVKGFDTQAAADNLAPLLGGETRLLTLQNGLVGLEQLQARFGSERLLAGVTYVPAVVTEPASIRHTGPVTRTVFGPANGQPDPVAERLAAAMTESGIETHVEADPIPALWVKYMMLTAFHIISATTRLPLGGWIDVPETRALYADAMAEVASVAAARGVRLPADQVARNVTFAQTVADRRTRASMLEDLERGRRLELEALVGWLVAEGERLSVQTPIHRLCLALLRPHEAGTPPLD